MTTMLSELVLFNDSLNGMVICGCLLIHLHTTDRSSNH